MSDRVVHPYNFVCGSMDDDDDDLFVCNNLEAS